MQAQGKPNQFTIDNWVLNIQKNDIRLTIDAENLTNSSVGFISLTNEDVTKKNFKLIEDINDLYECLIEGAEVKSEGRIKLSMSNEGTLVISQTIIQGKKERTFLSEIYMEKKELNQVERLEKEMQKTIAKQENRMKELEDLIRGVKSDGEKRIEKLDFVTKEDFKKYVEAQDLRMKQLEDKILNLLKNLDGKILEQPVKEKKEEKPKSRRSSDSDFDLYGDDFFS